VVTTEKRRQLMGLKERWASGEFTFLAELQPPKGTDLSDLLRQANSLQGHVQAFNIPDLQNAILRMGSLPVCTLLKKQGLEAIFNLSCIDRNRLALQSELLNASAVGMENVLILQGDSPALGDHYDAKPVFDLDLPGLLGAAKRLQEGYDLAGNELQGKPRFCVGSRIQIRAKSKDFDLETAEMEKQIALGVNFFLTSSVYDPSLFEAFIKRTASLGSPILASVTLLKSAGMARYIDKHVEGASIPGPVIEKLMKAPDKQTASVEIARETIRQLKPLCKGIEIVPIGWESLIPAVLP
jgi:methylenetetrahydrofolate reductase (NADPH)